MTTNLITPLGRDVNTILAADTPLRIDRPQGVPRIKTVRGGTGTPQNQDNPSSSKLDYTNEPVFGALNEQKIVFLQETNTARVLLGSAAPQTFDNEFDVDLVTEQITVSGHGFVTGQGPLRITSPKTDITPAGINEPAFGTLTFTGNAANTETVTIGAKTYTFQTVLTDVDGNVFIGATASDSIDNLVAAITLGAGAGTLYAASTTAHPSVIGVPFPVDSMLAQAISAGAVGNAIDTTETLSAGSWGGATLVGGVDTDYFAVRVTDDDFSIALTRQDALDGTVVDLGNNGTGTGTVSGTHNVAFPPGASVQDGSSGMLLEAGESIELPANSAYTLVGDTGSVTSFYFA